jgi:hypothetical protein
MRWNFGLEAGNKYIGTDDASGLRVTMDSKFYTIIKFKNWIRSNYISIYFFK